jgi:restriction system protein
MGRNSFLVQVVRASQQAARETERARVANARAQARYQAAASREEKRALAEALQDEAESMTDELEGQLAEIDEILWETLLKDDYFELENLRKNVAHPTFLSNNSTPEKQPSLLDLPAEPIEKPPAVLKLFGWLLPLSAKQNFLDSSKAKFLTRFENWKLDLAEAEKQNHDLLDKWQKREQKRLEKLGADEAKYKDDCLAREIEIQKANAELDALIAGLPRGKKDAVETYAELVLGDSEYPEGVGPEFEVSYDELSRELAIELRLASPSAIPDVAGYRFQKSSGEILEKKQTLKEIKSRYEQYVCNAVLRTMHEVLEADRGNVVRLISVVAFVDHVSASTGTLTRTNLVEVATDRESFLAIDLKNVVAIETLSHLGAGLSKNMVSLTPVQSGRSVRKA